MKKWTVAILLIFLASTILTTPTIEARAEGNDRIINLALEFKGFPYQFGGNTPAGFDCSGYIRYIFSDSGIELPRTSEQQFEVGEIVPDEQLLPGDIVFFENTYKAGISHAGIYLGNNEFISAENPTKGVSVSTLKGNPYWGVRYIGAKRMIGQAINPTPTPVKPAKSFLDLQQTHPAYEAILDLNGKGIVNGFLDNTFKPEILVTRGQAAAMLNRELKLTSKQPIAFSDVSNTHTFASHIAAMNEFGILKGYETGAFGIDDPLTRGQLAVIIDRAFKMQEKAGLKIQAASLYNDVPETYWAAKSIQALKILDRTTIFQSSDYDVVKQVTRAEFSAAVYSALGTR